MSGSDFDSMYAAGVDTLQLGIPINKIELIQQLVEHFEMPPNFVIAKLSSFIERGSEGIYYHSYILEQSLTDPHAIELVGFKGKKKVRLAIIKDSPLQNSFAIEPVLQNVSDAPRNAEVIMQTLLQRAFWSSNKENFQFTYTDPQGNASEYDVILKHNIGDGSFTIHFCTADRTEKIFELAFDRSGKLIDGVNLQEMTMASHFYNPNENMYRDYAMAAQMLYQTLVGEGYDVRDTIAKVRYSIENSDIFEKLRIHVGDAAKAFNSRTPDAPLTTQLDQVVNKWREILSIRARRASQPAAMVGMPTLHKQKRPPRSADAG